MQENSSIIFTFALVYAVALLIRWVVCNLRSLLWFSLLLLCLLAYFLYIGWVKLNKGWVKLNKWVNHFHQLKGTNLWALCVRGAWCVLSTVVTTVVNTLFSCLGTTFFSQNIQTTQDTLQCTDPNRCHTPMERSIALYLLRKKRNKTGLTETEQKWLSKLKCLLKNFDKNAYIEGLKKERKI